jgi:hypothetical protein
MFYQIGWTTLPGLRGLCCSGFRATLTVAPDNEHGVAIEVANDAERDLFMKQLEEHFALRRFTNAGDAFDAVKSWSLENVAKSKGGRA